MAVTGRETGRDAPPQTATADREIVISRVISARRELVFEAFTEVRHLSQWWGPEGFTTTTRAFEFRVGSDLPGLRFPAPDGPTLSVVEDCLAQIVDCAPPAAACISCAWESARVADPSTLRAISRLAAVIGADVQWPPPLPA